MSKKFLFILLFSIVYIPLYTYAVVTIPGATPDTKLPTSLTVMTKNISVRAVNWMITMFWILTVGFLIYAAYLYLTAAGNEDNLQKAKKYIQYALIAGTVALLATSLSAIVRNLLINSGATST